MSDCVKLNYRPYKNGSVYTFPEVYVYYKENHPSARWVGVDFQLYEDKLVATQFAYDTMTTRTGECGPFVNTQGSIFKLRWIPDRNGVGFLRLVAVQNEKRHRPVFVANGSEQKPVIDAPMVNEEVDETYVPPLKPVHRTKSTPKVPATPATPDCPPVGGTCRFGAKCNRDNPAHHLEFHRDKLSMSPDALYQSESCRFGPGCRDIGNKYHAWVYKH